MIHERTFKFFFYSILTLIIILFVGQIVLGVIFFDEIKQHGLKHITECVWEGWDKCNDK